MGIEEAAAEGEKALDSGAYELFRAQGVNLLSLLYERMGQSKEAIALLDREMKQPVIQKDPAALRLLKYRRQALQSETAPKQKLSVAAKAWLEKIQLPWLDFSKPHALSDSGGWGPGSGADARVVHGESVRANQDRLLDRPG